MVRTEIVRHATSLGLGGVKHAQPVPTSQNEVPTISYARLGTNRGGAVTSAGIKTPTPRHDARSVTKRHAKLPDRVRTISYARLRVTMEYFIIHMVGYAIGGVIAGLIGLAAVRVFHLLD